MAHINRWKSNLKVCLIDWYLNNTMFSNVKTFIVWNDTARVHCVLPSVCEIDHETSSGVLLSQSRFSSVVHRPPVRVGQAGFMQTSIFVYNCSLVFFHFRNLAPRSDEKREWKREKPEEKTVVERVANVCAIEYQQHWYWTIIVTLFIVINCVRAAVFVSVCVPNMKWLDCFSYQLRFRNINQS